MNNNPLYNRDYSDGPKPAGIMAVGGPLHGRYMQMSDPALPFFQVPEDCDMPNPHLGPSCDPKRMVTYVCHLYTKDKCKDLMVYVASTVVPALLDQLLEPLYEIRWVDEPVQTALDNVVRDIAAFEQSGNHVESQTDIAARAFEQFGREVHKSMRNWDFNEFLAHMVERNKAINVLTELEALVTRIENSSWYKKG